MKNNTKEGIGIIIILIILIVTIIALFNTEDEKNYEYIKDGEFGKSKKCFYDENAYCIVDNFKIKVDNYYEAE